MAYTPLYNFSIAIRYILRPILKFIVLRQRMPKNTTIIRIIKPIFTANFVIYRHKRQILKIFIMYLFNP